ncbi:MAG: archaeosortase/exosortase family protein [Luteibaculum sp.]
MNKKLFYFLGILALCGIAYKVLFYFYGIDIHLYFMELVSVQAVNLLGFFGFDASISSYTGIKNNIFMGNSGILRVESGCDGVALITLFLCFAFAFPGPVKHKLWYIPLGVWLVHCFNIVRVAALVILADYNLEVMKWNHKYTFIILVYSFVFLLWLAWVKYFSIPHAKAKVA